MICPGFRPRLSWLGLVLCLLAFSGLSLRIAGAPVGQNGAVATVHPLATDAAIAALRKGGNAVDAAVAAALTLGVVDAHNSGIGGGCFMLLRTARGTVIALDGREMAPAAASRDMFLRQGKAESELSQIGALSIGIPGSLAVYEYAIRHFGKLPFKQLLLPAAELAEEGFTLNQSGAGRLQSVAQDLAKFDSTRAIFLKSDGRPYAAGERLRQPELAATYRAIAEEGIDWFYKGAFARRVQQWMEAHGGLITERDFAEYRLELREPIRSRYRDYEIVGFPPPSSGGAHVAQILNILENFDLKQYPAYSVDSIHLIAEAMKLAFADRAFWLGDPDFTKVPLGLVNRQYAAELAKRIDLTRASEVPSHGPADQFSTGSFGGKHTTHFSTADAEGNWVACTATINTTYGSKVVIPGTGVVMNNQMDDFSAQPGVPNAFGLVGGEANAVAPGKRPLSSMSPTIVFKNGRPILALGAAGGPTIISQTVVNLINVVDYGMSIEIAVGSPRLHHQWKPGTLVVEKLPQAVADGLRARGHELKIVENSGAAQLVGFGAEGFSAVHDPRTEGKAGGY